ncbi:MAG: hypothetical protein IJ080_08180 [Oscillospiraceae bacterium]|nr:hypothetical protein [Oscillospiraceae bacterium]
MDILFKETALRTKVKLTVITAVISVLWIVITLADPLPVYSLFLISAVGSNILLICLSLFVTIWTDTAFSAVLKRDIPLPVNLIMWLILHLAFIYCYSIFLRQQPAELYKPYLIPIPVIIGGIAEVLIFRRSNHTAKSTVSGILFAVISAVVYYLMFRLDIVLMTR